MYNTTLIEETTKYIHCYKYKQNDNDDNCCNGTTTQSFFSCYFFRRFYKENIFLKKCCDRALNITLIDGRIRDWKTNVCCAVAGKTPFTLAFRSRSYNSVEMSIKALLKRFLLELWHSFTPNAQRVGFIRMHFIKSSLRVVEITLVTCLLHL